MSTYRLTPHNDPLNTTIGDGRTIYHIITPYHPVKDVTTISKQDEAVEKHPIAKITHHTFFADKIELKGEAFKMSHSGDSYAFQASDGNEYKWDIGKGQVKCIDSQGNEVATYR